jgi:Abnormal spindle-like microcephaly-assoc'd, ASPM-SPD-2-Hydin
MRRLSYLLAALVCGVIAAAAVTQPGTQPAQAAGTPVFTPASGPLTFDFVSMGGSSTKSATVKNSGSAALKFSKIVVVGRDAGDFKITGDGCTGGSVAPGDTCKVAVTFTPSDTGTRVANLKFTDNTSCPDYVTLAGSGNATRATTLAVAATCEQGADVTDTVTNTSTVTSTTTTTTTTPSSPTLSASSIVIPKAATCASRRVVTIRFNAPKGQSFTAAKILLHGKTIKKLGAGDVKAKISLKGLPRGRFTLQVRATTAEGKHLTQTRHYVTCVRGK